MPLPLSTMKNNNTKIKKIKLIVSDVDGVLTDGRILISSNSEESKFFHVEDGTAAALAYYANLPIALISGRYSKSTELRNISALKSLVYSESSFQSFGSTL